MDSTLILTKIAKYRLSDNKTLLELRRVSRKYQENKDILFGQLVLNRKQSAFLYFSKDPFAQYVISRVHALDLWGCTGITDVSQLGGVHTLNLNGCTGITDVSQLGGVHTLYLNGCTGITDVSQLGGVHTLNLWGCTGITDVSMLEGKVKKLYR